MLLWDNPAGVGAYLQAVLVETASLLVSLSIERKKTLLATLRVLIEAYPHDAPIQEAAAQWEKILSEKLR